MTEKYLTITEAVAKYNLNLSRMQFSVRQATKNGLYKVIYRKRSKIFLRQDYLENWLKLNRSYVCGESLKPGQRYQSSLGI